MTMINIYRHRYFFFVIMGIFYFYLAYYVFYKSEGEDKYSIIFFVITALFLFHGILFGLVKLLPNNRFSKSIKKFHEEIIYY